MNLEHARELLVQERSELSGLRERLYDSGELDETQQESSGELSSYDQHPADQGSDTFERERDRSIDEGLVEKIEEIDAALQRVESGDYGSCQVCGRPIDDERLEALPATRFCRDHANPENREVETKGPDTEITQDLDPAD
jgi:DnaK suppressor protein